MVAKVIRAIKYCVYCENHTKCVQDEKWDEEEWRCTECGYFV